jgi:hypothetical protein
MRNNTGGIFTGAPLTTVRSRVMDEVPEALVMEKIPDSPLRNMPAG